MSELRGCICLYADAVAHGSGNSPAPFLRVSMTLHQFAPLSDFAAEGSARA